MLLNAAAECNRKRLDARIKERRGDGSASPSEEIADMPMFNGRRLDELTTEEYSSYLGTGGKRPRVIKVPKSPPPQEG